MTKDQLYIELNKVSAHRKKRLECANLILNIPSLFRSLLEINFLVNDNVSIKAAWVLEFVCERNIELIYSHLNFFTENITNVYKDSAVRPMVKICKFIIEDHYSKSNNDTVKPLKNKHKEAISEVCFHWLITEQKVAAKVYAMDCLLLLGRDFKWIYQELLLFIEREYYDQSPGFQAKARHIKNAIEKL